MKVRVDMEKLQISAGELFQLDTNLAGRYKIVLKRAFEKETRQAKFTIDKMGCSPELMEELGKDYLCLSEINPFVIVVSPDQADAPLLKREFSFREAILSEVFDKTSDAIGSVTLKSAMVGEINNGIDVLVSVDDLLRIKKITLSLDTLDSELGSIIQLNEMHRNLKENLSNESYVNKMIAMSKELRSFGDVRRFNILSRYPVSMEVGSFYTTLLGGVHVLRRGKKPAMVIHDGSYSEGIIGSCAFLPRSKKLLDELFRQKVIKYDCSRERIDDAIRKVEDDFLLEQDIDITGATEEVRIRRKRAVVEKHNQMPVAWHELNSIKKRLVRKEDAKSRILKSAFETRIKLAEPSLEDGVVWNLLMELDPACCDYAGMLRYNQQRFCSIFPHFRSIRKKYACHQIAMAFDDLS